MTSQDIKKQLKEPHFWNIVLTGQHAEPRTKAMLEAKGIITWLPLAPVRRQWGRILKEIHTPVIPKCVFVYISNEERKYVAKILPTSSTGSYTSRTAGPMQSEQVDICQRAHTNHYPQQGALYQGLDTYCLQYIT